MALPILLHEGPGGVDLHAEARRREQMKLVAVITAVLLLVLVIRSRRSS
ncbi:MAG: hypothetical protein QNJ88_02900 [Acidimicrobiia bacterium]|nr:hypothetical protein [Acidimicrobiia bacterium]